MDSLKDKTAKGLFWGGMNNGVQQLLGLAFGIILGRLLDPSDYGMTAMLAVFSVIANELQASGFKTGLINLKDPQHEDYNAVFWFNILAGTVLYVILFLAAPWIAAYYHHQTALIPLSRYVFLGFVFSSFGMAQSAYLTKQMQIKQIAKCGMTATMTSSIISVILAALGFGYWALATQYLAYIAVNTLLLWYFSPWRPSLITHHSMFVTPLRRLFPFSVRIMISAIVTQVNMNVMNLLLGRYYGKTMTGHYNKAYEWSSKGFLFVQNMLKQVDQTVLVGLHDEQERQLQVLRKMVRFTAFVSFPLLFGLGLVSHEFIVLAIGEKWTFSASLLPLLCLCGAFMPLSALLTDAVISQHRSDIYLWNTLVLGILQIALMVGLWREGIYMMVIAYTLLNIIWTFVWHFFVGRLMHYRLLDFLKDILPFALIAAAVMVATGWATASVAGALQFVGAYAALWLLLISRVLLASLLYYTVLRLSGAVILKECLAFIKYRRRLLMIGVLLCGAAQMQATDYRKLSGYVRQVVAREWLQPKSPTRSTLPKRRMTAFVKADIAEADALWEAYDCRSFARMGDISIVSIPISRLSRLSEHPAIRRIEARPSAMLLMDTTTTVVNALPAYQATDRHPAFTGKGVVVGVMDVGFDLTHPNFYDPTATQYRIGAFWDQLSKDTVGSAFPVGRDFVGYEAVKAQQRSYDGLRQTHGTHTLGIAAGGGYTSPFRGVAYESDICLVSNAVNDDIVLIDSADYDKYTTATDALGFKYIFDYADRQGKPCVASFSEGYPPCFDEDDSLFSAFLDSLSTPGHIIVASAGNEGIARTYLPKPKGMERAGAFLNVNKETAFYRISSEGPLRLHLYAYDEDSTPHDTLTLTSEDPRIDSLLTSRLPLGEDTCSVFITRYASTFGNDSIYQLAITADTTLSIRPVALVIEGASHAVEVFGSSTYAFKDNAIDNRWNAAQAGHDILAPSCFPSVICVGATAHRLGFTNYEGTYKDYSYGYQKGFRGIYSSTGPTIDGLIKPDVMAPGNNVISSYSSYYLEENPDARDIGSDVEHFDFEGRTYAWNANSGTSMSAPVVAGTIALWLQANPQLSTADVKDLLSRTCRRPEASAAYPNVEYGYGEIDAYRGLLCILGIDKIEGVSTYTPSRLHLCQYEGRLRVTTRQPTTSPLSLRLYDLSGTLLSETSLPMGITEADLPLPASVGGIYIVQADSRDGQLSGSRLIRL